MSSYTCWPCKHWVQMHTVDYINEIIYHPIIVCIK